MCPKCATRVGVLKWAGSQCSCEWHFFNRGAAALGLLAPTSLDSCNHSLRTVSHGCFRRHVGEPGYPNL